MDFGKILGVKNDDFGRQNHTKRTSKSERAKYEKKAQNHVLSSIFEVSRVAKSIKIHQKPIKNPSKIDLKKT